MGASVSLDGGLTWENRSNGLPRDWYQSIGVNEQTGTVFISNTFSSSYRSIDGGLIWEVLPIPASVDWESGSQGEVFAGTGNILYTSVDDGVNWSSTILPVAPISNVEVNDAGHVFVSSGDQFGNGNGVCVSFDNGATFNIFNTGLSNLAILDLREFGDAGSSSPCDGNEACLDEDGFIYYWDEAAMAWRRDSAATLAQWNRISDLENTGEHYLCAATSSQIFISQEQFCTWAPTLPVFDRFEIQDVEQLNDGGSPEGEPTILVGTFGGGIFRGQLTVTGVEPADQPIPDHFALEQNYPNPFNPTTAISYQLTAVSQVSLTIFDLLGREVATLVNERKAPGTYEARWDAAGRASGVYFYRLKAGEYVATKKLVLLR